jgi:DNA-binding transcriptional MerR regulator
MAGMKPPVSADTAAPHLRIGELARLSGRSVHTIRWYEAQGLMPGAARDAGGRRVFSQAHVDWLELMDRLRQSGMSIRQMQAYARQVRAGKATLGARQRLLREHRARVEQQVQELQRALALIDRKVALYDTWIRKHGAGDGDASAL